MPWEPVTTGRSGALVTRAGDVFRKQTADESEDLRLEAERLSWLRMHDIPAPEVLESRRSLIVTRAVPGLTADDPWPEALRPRVVAALARLTADIHALPIEACPFDRRLAAVIPEALEADVDLDDLDPERTGWSRDLLVEELLGRRPKSEDLVVCHGDLSLPNVLLDPESAEVTGVIDAGRLGVADRWTDLALLTRSLDDPDNDQFSPGAVEAYLAGYGIEPDREKCDYYRLLDEFF
ncbi:APH(3') family aminoglycoside O-phosphotransferase [Aeromicrobium sp. P5_D10]